MSTPALPPLEHLRQVVSRLRAPDGCPWDREQTHQSIRGDLLEEAYEVLQAINSRDDANLCEELGDLLLQVVFHSQIASEQDRFNFDQVAAGITEKLIRRHPHVFGDANCSTTEEVLVRWEQIKQQEKGGESSSLLDSINEALPALMRAEKIQKKVAKVGFDWTSPLPVLAKVREELAELEAELQGDPSRLEDELGDVLFSVVNLSRKLKIQPEVALHRASDKFSTRFKALESLAQERGVKLDGADLSLLDPLWDEVKRREAADNR